MLTRDLFAAANLLVNFIIVIITINREAPLSDDH